MDQRLAKWPACEPYARLYTQHLARRGLYLCHIVHEDSRTSPLVSPGCPREPLCRVPPPGAILRVAGAGDVCETIRGRLFQILQRPEFATRRGLGVFSG